MKLIINIPENDYELVLQNDYSTIYKDTHIAEAVKSGTPLLKGHGDLKDMGNLRYVFDLTRDDLIYSGKDIERAIKSMKTIIEADKEIEE